MLESTPFVYSIHCMWAHFLVFSEHFFRWWSVQEAAAGAKNSRIEDGFQEFVEDEANRSLRRCARPIQPARKLPPGPAKRRQQIRCLPPIARHYSLRHFSRPSTLRAPPQIPDTVGNSHTCVNGWYNYLACDVATCHRHAGHSKYRRRQSFQRAPRAMRPFVGYQSVEEASGLSLSTNIGCD